MKRFCAFLSRGKNVVLGIDVSEPAGAIYKPPSNAETMQYLEWTLIFEMTKHIHRL
jgi:hypothetical protein